ncbi:MAG: YaiI/YqxD family protein [Candidatus Auribacterota bacterium]
MLNIYVDADACPVKREVYRVAERYNLAVTLVSNTWMQVPEKSWITLEVVGGNLDEADDWIVDHLTPQDIVITADILLAGRCLKKEAYVIGTTGKSFNENNIGNAVAARAIMSDLRDMGEMTGGPPPFQNKDRSNFLQELDRVIQLIRRKYPL